MEITKENEYVVAIILKDNTPHIGGKVFAIGDDTLYVHSLIKKDFNKQWRKLEENEDPINDLSCFKLPNKIFKFEYMSKDKFLIEYFDVLLDA